MKVNEDKCEWTRGIPVFNKMVGLLPYIIPAVNVLDLQVQYF
jgi:hypothetical protein